MRKRIGQLSRGKIEYVIPKIIFSEELLRIQAYTDIDFSGSFTLSCKNDRDVRGIVYSSNDRMECLTPQFSGGETTIRYRFHSCGMTEGAVVEGEFLVVANGTVEHLPYKVSVRCRYPESSVGEICNLYDFTQLAKEHWQEAYRLFYHKNFKNLIRPKEFKEAMIYKGILAAKPSNRNLEEFFVGIHKKQRVSFSLKKKKYVFEDVKEDQKEVVTLTKDGWGFFDIRIRVDGDFLVPGKDRLTPDDFIGNNVDFSYMILKDRLHAGKNFGCIIFEDMYVTLKLEIMVTGEKRSPQMQAFVDRKRKIRNYKAKFMELYQLYRLKQVVTGIWANESVEILNQLIELEPDEPMYALQKAQAFIINRQRQDAEWILDEFKRTWTDRKAPIWGYYLYLLTLMEREPAYVDKMTYEIQAIQRENPDSALLFWVLSFLEEKYYNNNGEKLNAIKRWVLDGNISPYLYVEAYYLFCQDPYLLKELGVFEMRILKWAVRSNALNKDLAIQIFEIIESSRKYSEDEYRLLCAAYEVFPAPENVGMICGYLIKGQKYEPKYHHWYEAGIEMELRITNLYEAYLMSMDEHQISNVPKIIQMYFQYESRLPYKKMAVLYNNIITSKKKSPDIYEKYRTTMSKFAMEQVERERIDDNLAMLYTEMLDLGLVNEELARHLSKILFTKRVVVLDDQVVRVWVYQRQTKEPQIVPVVDHAAYVQLFSKEYVVLFEDSKGYRIVGTHRCEVQALMDPDPYLDKCMNLAPDELPYIIRRFDSRRSYLNFTPEDEKFFERIIYSPGFSDEYRGQMIPEILRYYHIFKGRLPEKTENEEHTCFADYLEQVDTAYLSEDSRKFYCEMLVEHRMWETAWAVLQEYGIDTLNAAGREKLVCAMISQSKMNEDEFLLKLAYSVFREGLQKKELLEYLGRYYSGSTDDMIAIWKAMIAVTEPADTKEEEEWQKNSTGKTQNSEEEKLQTEAVREDTDPIRELEERILSQILFSGEQRPDTVEIFKDYCAGGGEDTLIRAYLTVWADGYFLNEGREEDELLAKIRERYRVHKGLNDSCKLALLKSIADRGHIGGEDYRIADELLAEFTSRNVIFRFYKKFNRSLIQKYHLYDKVILEYRTKPGRKVTIHYSRDEDGTEFIAEDMINAYNGIYVKQFVMFFGEIIQYYISEEQDGQVKMSQSNRLANHDVYNQKDESRYSLINQILMSNILREEDSLKRYMLRYQELDEMTRNLFHTL